MNSATDLEQAWDALVKAKGAQVAGLMREALEKKYEYEHISVLHKAVFDLLKSYNIALEPEEPKPPPAASATKPESPTKADDTTPSTRPTRREKREFWQVSNKFFDWPLKMPAAYRLVWACLHRHANGRPGRQAKVSTVRIGKGCNLRSVTVRQAIKFLGHIGAVHVLEAPVKKRKGRWSPGVYYVPPVPTLDLDTLTARIASAPKGLLSPRPDAGPGLKQRRKRGQIPPVDSTSPG